MKIHKAWKVIPGLQHYEFYIIILQKNHMWNDPLPGQIINLNKGLIGFFCFYKSAAIIFFLNVATVKVKSLHKAQLAFQ